MEAQEDAPDTPEWRSTSSLSGGIASATTSRYVSFVVLYAIRGSSPLRLVIVTAALLLLRHGSLFERVHPENGGKATNLTLP